jgi:hypothetical protein
MDLSPSPVPSSSVVPPLLNLRRSPVLPSFTGPLTRLAHQSVSQFLCRSPVTEPTSFAGPPFVHGSTDMPRSPVRFPVPLPFRGHRTYVVRRSSFRSRVHGPASLTTPVPNSCRSRVYAPASFIVPRFVSPLSVLRSSVIPRFSSPFALGSMDLSGSSFPTSSVLHRFPLHLLFISSQKVHDVCMYRPR